MLTARNVFSSSFTISAACGELTGTTCSIAAAVERARELASTSASTPPTTFGTLRVLNCRIARIDALGREREEEIDAGLQPARFEHRLDELLGRAGIGRRFEDDEHARMQVRGDHLDRRHDVRHVGILRLPQRRRHADVDRVELRDDARSRSSRSGVRSATRRATSSVGTSGMYDVPCIDRIDLSCIEIDAGRSEPGARELDGERQADVAEADDADASGAPVDARSRLSEVPPVRNVDRLGLSQRILQNGFGAAEQGRLTWRQKPGRL